MQGILEAGGMLAICILVALVLREFLKPDQKENPSARILRRMMTVGCWIIHGGRTVAFATFLILLMLRLAGN